MNEFERRIAELEQQLARALRQIATLEVHVRELQNARDVKKNQPRNPESLAAIAKKKGGKLY